MEAALATRVPARAKLAVGLSGGLDSMVLLDLMTRIAARHDWRLSAIHVNHQISRNADAWAAFCRRECRARGVPLKVVRVTVPRGNSLERAARDARYHAYQRCGATHLALAHHQDDQAETVLLRLLRGAGVRGMAAMPVMRGEGTLVIVRPLLHTPRSELEAYAREHKLNWITDDSNADTHYLRNFLRQDILPRIEARVPAWRVTLAQIGRAHV